MTDLPGAAAPPRRSMTGDDVRAAAAACVAALQGAVERDWAASPVPGLDFSVASVVAHAAEGPAWYALDLAAGSRRLDVITPTVDAAATPVDLLAALETAARVASAVIDAAPASTRGFHPFGWADAGGFAAMSCDELLVHTDDACRGLGIEFRPPAHLAEAVLARLFPWWQQRDDEDPWTLLLWANGRTEVPGRASPRDPWLWWSAPLDEWDGTVPDAPPKIG